MSLHNHESPTAYKRVFDRLAIYVLAVFLSPVLFGACLALYSMAMVDDSWGFGPTVFVTALYSLPFFALGAFPVSLYIDSSVRTKQSPRWIKSLLYTGAGSIAGLLSAVQFGDMFSIPVMALYGAVGALVHFGVVELVKRLFR
ncbi:hypothetical protein ABE021_01320 [Sporosarcina gallistercoris]|uniref:hypothetical protein n=1 Tax=Sporosarcina gallistercoris TaxID=2762245 RepID=UPI003D2A7AB9